MYISLPTRTDPSYPEQILQTVEMPANPANRYYVSRSEHPPTSTLPEFDGQTLNYLLGILARLLYARRHKKTTLVVHDGVVMVHCGYRKSTSVVHYIGSTLPEELDTSGKEMFTSSLGRAVGVTQDQDTRKILKECIAETAKKFNENKLGYHLERNWMNTYADITLSLNPKDRHATTLGLVEAAMKDETRRDTIVFDSPGLRLVAIPFSWMLALKLKYFTPEDKEDLIAVMRRVSTLESADKEALQDKVIRQLMKDCPQMGYDKLSERDRIMWTKRISECAEKATSNRR